MASVPSGSRKLPVDCEVCRLSVEGLCRNCAPELQRVIAQYKSTDRTLTAGDIVFRAAEPCDAVYHLMEGWAFLYNLIGNGRRQIPHFALPGALLGLYPARIAVCGAQALTDATVSIIPHKTLTALVEDHPELDCVSPGRSGVSATSPMTIHPVWDDVRRASASRDHCLSSLFGTACNGRPIAPKKCIFP